MMAQFTQEDAIELGIDLSLLLRFEETINIIWKFLKSFEKANTYVTVTNNNDNTIQYKNENGNAFIISILVLNNDYLSLRVEIDGNNKWEAKIDQIDLFGKEGIIRTLTVILTYAENIKN